MRYPFDNYRVTSNYGDTGPNWSLGYHTGTDFIGREKEVKAIIDGIVRVVTYDTNYGNYVSVGTLEGKRILYCHLSSVNVEVGQEIKEGAIIGIEGDTGNTTGAHLHLEVRVSPYASVNTINPIEYIEENIFHTGIDEIVYNTIEELPPWYKPTIQKLIDKQLLRGDENGLNLSESMVRVFVVNDRAGLYDLDNLCS